MAGQGFNLVQEATCRPARDPESPQVHEHEYGRIPAHN